MNKAYNNISLGWGIPGVLLQLAGIILEHPLVLVIWTVLLLIGLACYAKAKGRSGAWCLMGFLSIIGLIVPGCLKDIDQRISQKRLVMPERPSQSNPFAQLEKLGSLKEKGILTEDEFRAQKEKHSYTSERGKFAIARVSAIYGHNGIRCWWIQLHAAR